VKGVDGVALTILIILFVVVTGLGFAATRWRRVAKLDDLDEWGLGGRNFGTFVTWFLLGGDLYTAYTFVAVPAALYSAGSLGFFAVPYTIIVYPLVLVIMPRLWSVAHRHGYITPADFVRGRFGSDALMLVVALTGILALMPYIALQLVGIQAVLEAVGLPSSGTGKDIPLLIAFVVLAAYTYTSGLRAPALIAFVKDALIYLVVIVAIIYIPIRLGGYQHIFAAAAKKPKLSLVPKTAGYAPYWTLALGSAMALFMYPHSITAVLASKNRNVIRRNAAILPAYSLVLAFLALLGYMAIAAGVKVPVGGNNLAVPLLFRKMFPSWFAGVGDAAIVIGALVPAAIMSIAAANLFTRNVWKLAQPDITPSREAKVAKLVSLLVKFGALLFVLFLKVDLALNFQLLGGIWILQTFPAIVGGLYTRITHRWALLAGWATGMVGGTLMAYWTPSGTSKHFGAAVYHWNWLGLNFSWYAALTALLLNLIVVAVGSLILGAVRAPTGVDETVEDDFDAVAVPRLDPAPVG